MDGVPSSAQKCIIKAQWGPKCKLVTGNFKDVSDVITRSWTSDPNVVQQLDGFLKGNFGGGPPHGKMERIRCVRDVPQQLDRIDDTTVQKIPIPRAMLFRACVSCLTPLRSAPVHL